MHIISGRLSSRSGKHQIVPGLVLYIVHYTDACEQVVRYTHKNTHTHTLSPTHSHALSLSLTLTHTHTLTHPHTRAHTLSHTHARMLSLSHTHTHTKVHTDLKTLELISFSVEFVTRISVHIP